MQGIAKLRSLDSGEPLAQKPETMHPALQKIKTLLVTDFEFSEEQANETISDESVVNASRAVCHLDSHFIRSFSFFLKIEKGVSPENIRKVILSCPRELTIARAAHLETDLNAIRDLLHLLCGFEFDLWDELLAKKTEIITILPLQAVKNLSWWRNLLVAAGLLEQGPLRTEFSLPGVEFYTYMLSMHPYYVNHSLVHSRMQLKHLWKECLTRNRQKDLLSSSSQSAIRLEARFKLAYMMHYADVLIKFPTKRSIQEGIQNGKVPFLILSMEDFDQPWKTDPRSTEQY